MVYCDLGIRIKSNNLNNELDKKRKEKMVWVVKTSSDSNTNIILLG